MLQQTALLPDLPAPAAPAPVSLGSQADIHYLDAPARGVLNPPETTGMGFWSINPYVGCAFGCAYCYARYAHRWVMERRAAAVDGPLEEGLEELPAWLAFERRIFVKRNAAAVLRAELQSASDPSARHGRSRGGRLAGLWRGEAIVIGSATDPYQPAERSFRVTRGLLEVLAAQDRLRVVIITKSALVSRDLDVLSALGARARLTIHLSLITLDRELARRIEPRAPTPEARLRTLERLAAAGIDVGINIMPVLPGLTDRPAMLDALVRRVAQAGASHVNACALRLRVTARQRYLPFIASEFPHLAARYRSAYAAGHQLSDRYRDGLRRFLRRRCREHGIRYGTPELPGEAPYGSPRAGLAWAPDEDEAAPVQLALALGGGPGAR